ncbi:glycoside hydrolase family 97 protein [Chitinophaga agrisoli]|uniref:Glycoside hydrolase family 97 protein n=1 Tax=Chitinophaga agrisoli TaxID=2607653 RepID=A0A5B2VYA1_9BACT|nr:glycoside hydrolase family 97 protein [Chitinophaga agrisoli]KAA2243302.1 glycoside hydrolase family 97 protein [Chitinophaga agrisoli]
MAFLCPLYVRAADTLLLKSPHQQLLAKLFTRNGYLLYQVQHVAQLLIAPSQLGIQVNGRTAGTQVRQLTISHRPFVHANSLAYTITVQEKEGAYTLECRMFDNGAAFRYVIGGPEDKQVTQELTSFTLPPAAGVWYFERNSSWKLQSYAGLWQRTTVEQLPTVSSQGPVQGKPLVIELPHKQYAVLTEAALYNYSGMRLKATGNNTLQVNFTEGDKGFAVKGKLVTPWRVILYANNLNGLVNNQVIAALNPQPDPVLFADKTYIKPGRSVWSWITRNTHYMEPAEELRFIHAAAALSFEYTLIDEGWETKWPHKWQQLKSLCDSAAQTGVGVWVWKHSKEIRDSVQRNVFLDSVAMAGAVGIKTDFMNSEAMDLINFEEGLLQAAAARRLMVNFHGCQAPTGESHTYPNEMTREGIRGMELNIMKEPIPAWHNAALPFTRFVCGNGDYTPGFFSNRGNTTLTHQLALCYLFNSSFQCIAESPLTLLEDSTYAPILPFLKTLPVTWDETIVLPGSDIGVMAAFARRKGKDWYVAVINGTDTVQRFTLQPRFLQDAGIYKSTLVKDSPDGKAFVTERTNLRKQDRQQFMIPATGGLVIHIPMPVQTSKLIHEKAIIH